jgi:C4-dicarboxylate transporter DctQ subunit
MTENVSENTGLGDQLEESLIAIFLGLMTLITFANVIARYVFNDNILWALEATVFLFAWMVLLGASYGVKKSLHLGVDIVVDYWYPFVTKRAFLETNDVPMPEFLQFIAIWLNEGEKYEKIPRFIPYAVLPLSMALLTWRICQAGWRIWKGDQQILIASHEAEELLQEVEAGRNDQTKREG